MSLYYILVVITMAIVPLVTGGYNYQAPSKYLELPNVQSPNSYGQLGVQNVPSQNVQSTGQRFTLTNYQNNILRNHVRIRNFQPLVQATYNYEVPLAPISAPLHYRDDKRTVYPTAIGVQPPNLRNIVPQILTNPHQEITASVGASYPSIANNQLFYQEPLNSQGNSPTVNTGLNSDTNYSSAPVFYGFQPVVSQVSHIASPTVQQQNPSIATQVVNQEIVQQQQQQQQYNNGHVLQEQILVNNHVAEGVDEETVVEEEISYPPNLFNTYSNQQSNVQLSNSVTENNIVSSNTQTNVVSPVVVSYDTSIPVITSPQPVVTKHIYFHVPPPEVEEAPLVNNIIPPAKKNFNIIFIKVPSQEYLSRAEILRQLQGRHNSVEEKTLIYVLVKKPESLPVSVVGQSVQPSKPEVFFVKYKGDPHDDLQTLQSSNH